MNPFLELFFMLLDLYTMVVLMRFFMQHFRVDYYNPLSQFVVKMTDPLIKPLRKAIPGFSGIDWSSIVLAWLLILLQLVIYSSYRGVLSQINPVVFVLQSCLDLVLNTINLFTYLIFIRVILSWVAPPGANPVALLFYQLTEPLLRPFRRWFPAAGGMDFTPLIAGIALYFFSRLLVYYVQPLIA